jgi:hypothetical protein
MHLILFHKSLSSIFRGGEQSQSESWRLPRKGLRQLPASCRRRILSSASANERANAGAQHAKAHYTMSVSLLVDIEQRQNIVGQITNLHSESKNN